MNIFKYSSAANSAYNVAAWRQPFDAVPCNAMGLEDVPIAFFSYCREDSEFALKLAADLKVAGASVWIDQLDIEPGTPWDRAVEDALTNSPHMLVVLSPVSVKSDNVRDEVSFALSRQKRVIPVLYRDCDVPFRLARLQHIDFRADYERALSILLRALGVGRAPHSQPPILAAAAAEIVVSLVEPEEQAPQQSEAEDHASQEQSRREQRAAEQARLEAEARLAAERVRLAQQEKERREAEIKARQEQLRREEQESVERKGLVLEPEPKASLKMPEAQPLPPQITISEPPAPESVPIAAVAKPMARPVAIDRPRSAEPETRVPPPRQPLSSAPNFASPKYLAGGAAIVVALALVIFLLVHRSGTHAPSDSKVAENTSAETAAIQPAGPQTASGISPSEPAQAFPSAAPASTPDQDKAKAETSPAATGNDLAKVKNQARPGAELSDLNLAGSNQPLNAANAANLSNAATTSKRVRLTQGVSHGMLMYEVAPKYPPLARSARVQGQVVLDVVIGKDGSVSDIRAENGHPWLIPAAIDAVKHWRYKPYKINGKPVEVDTKVIVNFTLTNS
jgi:TonB family protein